MVVPTSDRPVNVRFSAEWEPLDEPQLPMYTYRVKVYCHNGLGKSLELTQVGASVESVVGRLRRLVGACERRSPRVKQAIIEALNRLERR